MKNLLLAAALSFSVAAHSQEPKILRAELQCFPLKTVLDGLKNSHKEMVRWAGQGNRLEYLLLVNPKTKTWSLGMTDGTLYCSLGEGTGFVEVELNKSTL